MDHFPPEDLIRYHIVRATYDARCNRTVTQLKPPDQLRFGGARKAVKVWAKSLIVRGVVEKDRHSTQGVNHGPCRYRLTDKGMDYYILRPLRRKEKHAQVVGRNDEDESE